MDSYSILELVWLLFTLVCLVGIGAGLGKISSSIYRNASNTPNLVWRYIILITGWLILLFTLAKNGFFAVTTSFPPRLIISIVVPSIAILLFAFSTIGVRLLNAVPAHSLILMQSFRIVVEILIWYTYVESKLPIQMTFEGKNADILSGLLALPAGYYLWKYKKDAPKLVLAYNLIGIALLLNILIVAVLSFPTPLRYFTNEPSNIIISRFPYIVLPGVLVPIAIAMHVFSLRKMVLNRDKRDGLTSQVELP